MGMCGTMEQCGVLRHNARVRNWIICGVVFGLICLICCLCVICGACTQSNRRLDSEDDYMREENMVHEHRIEHHSSRYSSHSNNSSSSSDDKRKKLEPGVVYPNQGQQYN